MEINETDDDALKKECKLFGICASTTKEGICNLINCYIAQLQIAIFDM